MDINKLLALIMQTGPFIAAFAAISAGIIMHSVTKKFGTGILASGFKTISIGIIFIALGIILDAVNQYLQSANTNITTVILFAKDILFVLGTYIIVIGSKRTGDKLESLMK